MSTEENNIENSNDNTNSTRIDYKNYQEIILKLQNAYPKAFPKDKPLPLKKGVFAEIADNDSLKETRTLLRQCIRMYTTSFPYLKAVIKLKKRYDLEGKETSIVNDQELEYTQQMIDLKKGKDRKKPMNQ